MARQYKAVVKALPGNILFGGVLVHDTCWYNTREEAEHLRDLIASENKRCGRLNDGGTIKIREAKQEEYVSERCARICEANPVLGTGRTSKNSHG
jgi:hypothetical protein